MIFRREPLLDADWLLGPTEPQPRSFIRKDVCAVILVTTIAIVAGWNQLSSRIMADSQPSQLAANTSVATSCFGPLDSTSIDGALANIDESHIRTVDRFVPRTQTNIGKSSSNSVEIKTVSLPISLPHNNLNSAVESHFEVADLRTDANLIVPLDLLAIRMLKPDEQLTLNKDVDAIESNKDGMLQSGDALVRSDRQPQVIRTVAYTGNPSQDNMISVSTGEPPRINGNVSRLPASANADRGSVDSQGSLENEPQFPGLENRSTGEVVRLLGSVQTRLAGAAVNELKRRGFTDSHLQLAVDLASGRTEARIAAMERLISEPGISPLQWLVWLAEDEDRKIREHSIRLLSSMPGEDVRIQIRLLMNREKDAGLYDLLRKASLSSGAVSTNYEKKR